MYRIPNDLDLAIAIGQATTQLCIGQYNFQFAIGDVHFAVYSEIAIKDKDGQIGRWTENRWPDPIFFSIINVPLMRIEIPDDKTITLVFDSETKLNLLVNSDQYESMQISIKGTPGSWII